MPCDSKALDEAIDHLQQFYPFIKVQTIGLSVLGIPIKEIRIGEGKRKVHMNASFHANEWITTTVLMNLVNKYLFNLSNRDLIRGINPLDLYQNVELSVVPMVNPDGVNLVINGPPSSLRDKLIAMNEGCEEFVHWKANINGVDLNKQYPANWELLKNSRDYPNKPGPRDYPGTSPLTEPEAIMMAELAKKNGFDCVVAFHTQGSEFYWGYEGCEPFESEKIAREFERVSGYKAIRYVDSHAGYKDWYIKDFKRAGFTLELGKGINPLPLSQYNEIIDKVEGIFLAALYYGLY
jgi:g-D-glutamyl-meso-diaminopimelate peptidase